ncbi:transcriptional repressor TCF25-domain-containing protein [Zychaea mexicana]|uniref:transcriptional repressor TCF25-domain-containing protein n=1 Tax=Zychaea mexicana TaxID=64656 RepID=UPI0022FED5DC|nr:transcriptional repressor TCF25-domain-containing protein [Zychaea mexicana]KAI9495455.1 transcriptional repressor TCF25-domain-containing protein [Zychaea mexicana]
MSSRALRKLQKQKLEELSGSDNEDSQDETPVAPQRNLFDLLNEGDDVGEDDEEDHDDEKVERTDEAASEEKTTPVVEEEEEVKPKAAATFKSKKNKKKKAKAKAKAKQKDVSDMSMQELDEALKELKGAGGESSQTSTNDTAYANSANNQFIHVNQRNLDAEAEMKRMFGSRIVNSETRGRVLKRSKLATPKVDWPPYKRNGLAMELLENKHGVSYFAFKHNEEYQDAQLEFLNSVTTHDPNALMFLVSRNPYHVDGLLQVSEMAKQSGDWTVAGDCIERALYACERAFHPHFTFGSGTVRLEYRRAENRSFFLAIFKHIQFLTRRGCWRTAFEFCKLLLSLDPESDPLGAMLAIDSYALTAKEYSYVADMASTWKTDGKLYPVNIQSLPNMAYSSAYAKFKLAPKESDTLLQEAIKKFPSVVPRLMDKLGESGFDDQPFLQTSPNVYLDLLQQLFVERTYELFKEPEVLSWLKENARAVANKLQNAYKRVDCAQNEEIPLTISRHIVLTDIQQLLSYLPSSVTSESYHMYDPLPPPDSVVGYDLDDRMRQAGSADQGFLDNILRNLLGGRRLPADRMREIRGLVQQAREQQNQRGDQLPGAFPQDDDDDFQGDGHHATDQDVQELLNAVTEDDIEIQQALAAEYEQHEEHDNTRPRQ